jgi:hypothetical protein
MNQGLKGLSKIQYFEAIVKINYSGFDHYIYAAKRKKGFLSESPSQ